MGAVRCAGILLTGGASRRMGRDKATLVFNRDDPSGTTLARRAADALREVAAPLVEVGPGVSGLASVLDDPPHRGPLVAFGAGLDALAQDGLAPGGVGPALAAASLVVNVVLLACDLPFVEAPMLAWLADHPSSGSVVPLAGDPARPQPLCARWSPAAIARVASLVAVGERSMRVLVAGADVTLVPPEQWAPAAAGRGAAALDDVDSPGDLARLRRLASEPTP